VSVAANVSVALDRMVVEQADIGLSYTFLEASGGSP
jgi:hypothetical protein